MSRPDFVNEEDIKRWSEVLEQDPELSESLLSVPDLQEVCFAGLWLSEELEKLHCPDDLVVRIQYTAAQLSFGRDIWEVHQMMLKSYKENDLVFEDSDSVLN